MGNNYQDIFHPNGNTKRSFSKPAFTIKDVIAIIAFVGTIIGMYTNHKVTESKFDDRLTHIEKDNDDNKAEYKEMRKGLSEIRELIIEIRTKLNEQERNRNLNHKKQ